MCTIPLKKDNENKLRYNNKVPQVLGLQVFYTEVTDMLPCGGVLSSKQLQATFQS